jgi:hypothetical protein
MWDTVGPGGWLAGVRRSRAFPRGVEKELWG